MAMKLLIHDVRFGEPFQVRPCGLWRPPLLLAQWLRAWLLLDRQATVSAAGAAQLKAVPISFGSVVALVRAVWLGKFLRFSARHLDLPVAIDWLLRTQALVVSQPAPPAVSQIALRVVVARYFVLRHPAHLSPLRVTCQLALRQQS